MGRRRGALIPVAVNEPFVFPDLEASVDVGEYVEEVPGRYRLSIIGAFDVMRSTDVVAMIDDVDNIARNERAPTMP